ncbi:cation:proton antiporter [Leucobacter triazinivorans]|uniref:Sodium:proton antiporter n=1 Tax=Leucobacter triazinivorans TaxID=1784719 RepID=A0A4P6KHG7_9MICO|nr:sodium:proton antiporter [Leucobacter triazinivorans]QBE49802.1 sodium:proton antiporter [Leucobacter triazinivorans]
MEYELVAVAAVILLVGASILGSRIRIAAPLLLVLLGIGIGYLPFVPPIEIDPEVILVVVLPPLLYAAAVNVPIVDFRRNVRPVVGLSVILVIISAVAVGFLVHWIVPVVPLPAAMALGAVVSPTDAVAATSIGKRLGMPERVVTILEGESLVNDATSLVLLKTAIAATAGSFALSAAAGTFALAAAVAIAIGLLIGVITVWVRSKLTNPVHDTIVSFTVPFIAFVPAEQLQASGVLAVVVTGLYTGHHASRRFNAAARMNERLNWRTVQFILENGVFLVMGLQLHSLVEQVSESTLQLEHIGALSLVLVAVLIACRAAFVTPLVAGMRGATRQYERRSAGYSQLNARVQRSGAAERADRRMIDRLRRLDMRARRSAADLAHEREQRLGWRDGVVLSWSGMRGVVTLAAAQSIPTTVPYRPQLVLAAFAVAVVTLLLHGLTLPALIRRLWPHGAGTGGEHAELTALSRDLNAAADEAIDEALAERAEAPDRTATPVGPGDAAQADEGARAGDPAAPSGAEADEGARSDGTARGATITEEAARRARIGARHALLPIAPAADPTAPVGLPGAESPGQLQRRLARVALDAQREALLEERAIGRYSSRSLRAAELALDAYETRLSPPAPH